VRPLHYALLHGRGIVFASDIRALFHDPGVPREWCPGAIDAYLALGYVPAPLTAYRRISKLEPAHALVVEGRSFHIERFWDLPAASNEATAKNAAAVVGGTLKASIQRELKDAKNIGLLYSGGIASCALLAATPPQTGVPLTVDLDHDPSELTRSDAAAARLGHSRELETIARPVSTLIDEVISTSGEPVGDPSALSQFAICQAAAQRVNVALSAHGAAALWSGNVGQRRLWDDRQRRSIYTRGFAWQMRDANPFACHLNARTILADRTIPVAEHAAVAAGIDLRMPFLDRSIVELATATGRRKPAIFRWRRPMLRQLIDSRLPTRLMPPVHGAPTSQPWLGAALHLLVPRMLLGPHFDGRGIVSRPALQTVWNEHVASRADHAHRLWALVMLEFWFRESIDGDAAAEPLEYAVLLKAA
jgi:asparagine synthetase B (glutamine-hydrolysing)